MVKGEMIKFFSKLHGLKSNHVSTNHLITMPADNTVVNKPTKLSTKSATAAKYVAYVGLTSIAMAAISTTVMTALGGAY